MTSLFERLAKKERRRVVVPIQLGSPAAANEKWFGIAAALKLAESQEGDERDEEQITLLREQVDEAKAAVDAHFVNIELQSLPAAEWEQLASRFIAEDGDGMNWPEALPTLLAASCVDEELQDEQRWRDTLSRPEWTDGDRDALKGGLMLANHDAPDPRFPKG